MIHERARVLEIGGPLARVSCERQAGCQRCAEGKGCGGGLFGAWLRKRLHTVEVRVEDPVAVGDVVLIGFDERLLVQAALTAYLLPLLLLLAGAVAGSQLGGDLAEIAGGVVGLTLGILLFRVIAGHLTTFTAWRPRVVSRLAPGQPCTAGSHGQQ